MADSTDIVHALGGIADHLIFQMAFEYHMRQGVLYTEALRYTLDKLAETQDFIPEWAENRNKEKVSV